MSRTLRAELLIVTESDPCDPTATKDNDVVSPAVGSPEKDILAFVDSLRKTHKVDASIWQEPGVKGKQQMDGFEVPVSDLDPVVIKRRVTF